MSFSSSNKWFWWGIGVILIVLGLVLKPAGLDQRPTAATVAPVIALPVSPTVAPVGPAADVTVIDSSVVGASADNAQPVTSATTLADESACPAGQAAPEGEPVWLTADGHSFANAPGRVFPSSVILTGQQVRDFCETTQTGPFGPEWVQVP